jgi:hypothetical protein
MSTVLLGAKCSRGASDECSASDEVRVEYRPAAGDWQGGMDGKGRRWDGLLELPMGHMVTRAWRARVEAGASFTASQHAQADSAAAGCCNTDYRSTTVNISLVRLDVVFAIALAGVSDSHSRCGLGGLCSTRRQSQEGLHDTPSSVRQFAPSPLPHNSIFFFTSLRFRRLASPRNPPNLCP